MGISNKQAVKMLAYSAVMTVVYVVANEYNSLLGMGAFFVTAVFLWGNVAILKNTMTAAKPAGQESDKNIKKITGFPEGANEYVKRPLHVKAFPIDAAFQVETPEGTLRGKPGDYLVQGIKGELYPCDKTVFLESYEEAKKP